MILYYEDLYTAVEATKGSPLSRVDLFAGNSFLGNKKIPPFTLSFVPKDVGLNRGPTTLRVVIYDRVLNKGTASVSINLR